MPKLEAGADRRPAPCLENHRRKWSKRIGLQRTNTGNTPPIEGLMGHAGSEHPDSSDREHQGIPYFSIYFITQPFFSDQSECSGHDFALPPLEHSARLFGLRLSASDAGIGVRIPGKIQCAGEPGVVWRGWAWRGLVWFGVAWLGVAWLDVMGCDVGLNLIGVCSEPCMESER